MSLRRKVGGKYFNVRERSSSKGKKGTIMGKWHPKKKADGRYSFWASLFGFGKK